MDLLKDTETWNNMAHIENSVVSHEAGVFLDKSEARLISKQGVEKP